MGAQTLSSPYYTQRQIVDRSSSSIDLIFKLLSLVTSTTPTSIIKQYRYSILPSTAKCGIKYDSQSVHPNYEVDQSTNILSSVSEILNPANITDEEIWAGMIEHDIHVKLSPKRRFKAQIKIISKKKGKLSQIDFVRDE